MDESPFLDSSMPGEAYASDYNNLLGDDNFSRWLLRPWSLVSHDDGDLPTSARISALDETWSTSEETYPRRRRKSLGAWARYSSSARENMDSEGQFAVNKGGWWDRQMLVDRSLRSMAALTAVFATAMIIVCCTYMSDFVHRSNPYSTSVGSKKPRSCRSTENANVVINLVINIAATMVLGMSNTYQQLVTSLKVDEIRWVLSKHGDSRIGTNSPLAINHKRTGKLKAWMAWLLLVSTSLPIHFLANSVIGPSVYLTPPRDIQYHTFESNPITDDVKRSQSTTRGCWTAFRSGVYNLELGPEQSFYDDGLSSTMVSITYSKPQCAQYKNTMELSELYGKEIIDSLNYAYGVGDCLLGRDVICILDQAAAETCRLSIRMFAGFMLAGCLTIKAIYMMTINIRARRRMKTDCLTFGDVVVASVLEPDLQIHNECLVNAGEGNRHRVGHTCHRHCSDSESSMTGDSIGHCQKCAKFNMVDKAADLLHPSIAIKYKKSLLSNLGSSALSQMIILMICSLCMLVVSIILAISIGSDVQYYNETCLNHRHVKTPTSLVHAEVFSCAEGLQSFLKHNFGSFGGFNTSAPLAVLQPDDLRSEIAAFAISNGTQLLFSILYLLLIYNITLISIEYDWGQFEKQQQRPRCTIVRGDGFEQSYLLQLPKKVLFPIMAFSATMHWLLGQAISTKEVIIADYTDLNHSEERSRYTVVFATYSIWLSTVLMMAMTATCWWAFTYRREGFIPQMYGSIRTCCAATTELEILPREGVKWGDLGAGGKFRHAGLSGSKVGPIVPAELYAGRDTLRKKAV